MKNKLKPLILIAFCFANFQLVSQSDSCATEPLDSASFEAQPWFGNNDYLLDLLDSLGYWDGQNILFENLPVEGGFDIGAKIWIPIKAWVYRNDNGTGGATIEQVEESIRQLNDVFSGRYNNNGQAHPHTMIQFYLTCNITFLSPCWCYHRHGKVKDTSL